MEDFYKNEWRGELDEAELPALLSRAEIIVNNAVMLSGAAVETAPEALRKPLYSAVCAQADYIAVNGGVSALSESGGSFSLGKFSYSVGGASLCGLCPQASAILETAGLLYRGVDVL